MHAEPSLNLITRRRFWWSVIAAISVLIGVGWGTDWLVVREEKASLRAHLEGLLEANVTSGTQWLDDRCAALRVLSDIRRFRHDITLLFERRAEGARDLAPWLEERGKPLGFVDARIVDLQGKTVWASNPSLVDHPMETEARSYLEQALQGKVTISPPLMLLRTVREPAASAPVSPSKSKDVHPEGPDALSQGEVHDCKVQPAMLGLSPLTTDEGRHPGVLVVVIEPADLNRILHAARVGKTGESYAIDGQGHMVSESRFLPDLVTLGLLPPGSTSTILRLDLRNPGPAPGARAAGDVARKALPYTEVVAALLSGRNLLKVEGYPDYRGVNVVGAGQWIDRYRLGIVVEMDASEAYQSVRTLRSILYCLLGLLLLALAGLLLYLRSSLRYQQRLARAEAQIARLGQYTLERKLGQGGMGEVYLARHALMRRLTAIKLLRLTGDASLQERFEREVRLGCQLVHPNTIALFDYGRSANGTFYYAMEYLEGLDLTSCVEDHGPMPAGRVIFLLTQACGSLAEAHGLNLVHRDIKPDNIMLCERGGLWDFVKVLDFGLVKNLEQRSDSLTAAEVVCGTPTYMAPEALEGLTVDGRADLYALAAVGYYLLTGHAIVEKKSLREIITAQMLDMPPLPSHWVSGVPRDLEAVLMGALAKDRDERPRDAIALRDALLACADAHTWTQAQAQAWWTEVRARRASVPAPKEEATPLPLVLA